MVAEIKIFIVTCLINILLTNVGLTAANVNVDVNYDRLVRSLVKKNKKPMSRAAINQHPIPD